MFLVCVWDERPGRRVEQRTGEFFFLFSFSWISENVVTWRQMQIKVVYIVLSRRGVKIVGLVNLSRCLIVVRFLDVGAIFLFIVLSSCCYVEKDAGEGRT